MGSCTPEARASFCERKSCRSPDRNNSIKSSVKTLPCQILLQPLDICKRPNPKKAEIASTRSTLKKTPTIVEAIDEYLKENGQLHHLEPNDQNDIKQTDSFLLQEEPEFMRPSNRVVGKLKTKKNASSFERREVNKRGLQNFQNQRDYKGRRWSPQGRCHSPPNFIHI